MLRLYLLGTLAVSVLSEYNNDEDYIVEGTDARKNEFPWQGEFSIEIYPINVVIFSAFLE